MLYLLVYYICLFLSLVHDLVVLVFLSPVRSIVLDPSRTSTDHDPDPYLHTERETM